MHCTLHSHASGSSRRKWTKSNSIRSFRLRRATSFCGKRSSQEKPREIKTHAQGDILLGDRYSVSCARRLVHPIQRTLKHSRTPLVISVATTQEQQQKQERDCRNSACGLDGCSVRLLRGKSALRRCRAIPASGLLS
jgi:hypothetical protein